MEYNKPVVVSLGSSIKAIQSSQNKMGAVSDGTNIKLLTSAAYEADE
jgi:hypothetical protein